MRIAALALTALTAGPAFAAEDEVLLVIEPLGILVHDAPGVGGSLAVGYGLSEIMGIFAAVGGQAVLERGPGLEAVAGLSAAFDVLRTVPFVDLAAGVHVAESRVAPLLRIGVGADYFLSAAWSLGAAVRYRPFSGADSAAVFSVAARIGYRFEL